MALQTTIVRVFVATLTLANVASGYINRRSAAIVPIVNQERSVTSKYLPRDQSRSLLSRLSPERRRNQFRCSELQVVASSSSEPQDNSGTNGMMNPLEVVGLYLFSRFWLWRLD